MSDKEFEKHYEGFPWGYCFNTKSRHMQTWQEATKAEKKRIEDLIKSETTDNFWSNQIQHFCEYLLLKI